MTNLSVIIVFVVLLCAYTANSETTNINSSGSNINSQIEGSATKIAIVGGDTNSNVNIGTNLNNINHTIDNSNTLLNVFYDNSRTVAFSLHASIYLSLALNVYLLISNRNQIKKLQDLSETKKTETS